MSSLNQVTLIGNLGQDPVLNNTSNGIAVANLSVATQRGWNDQQGQRQEETEWHRIVVWQKMATSCATYLRKGSKVGITGYLRTREWEDKEGITRYTTEIVAQNVMFLSPTNRNGNGNGPPEGPPQNEPPPNF